MTPACDRQTDRQTESEGTAAVTRQRSA